MLFKGDENMGILGNLIVKGVSTALTNSTIKTVGNATVGVIAATAQKQEGKEDAVVKNGVLYIKPTRSSEDYLNKDVLDIVQELLGAGFESITLKSIKKLGDWSIKKYGRIHSISINGKNEFLGIKKVPASSHIVIEYLDFKDGINQDVYANVNRIVAGIIHNVSDIEAMLPKDEVTTESSLKKYCSYCGESIQSEKAKFCSACGKEI